MSDHGDDEQTGERGDARGGDLGPADEAWVDPVIAKRRQIERLTQLGQRVGYGLFGLALVFFFVSLATNASWAITVVVWSLIAGCIVLAPSIVISFTVRAADRADREGDWR